MVATAKLVVIININPDWRIRSDPYNWMIEKRRKGGAKERWNAMGYYGDLDGAVLGLVQRRIHVMEGNTPTMPRRSRRCAGLWRAREGKSRRHWRTWLRGYP